MNNKNFKRTRQSAKRTAVDADLSTENIPTLNDNDLYVRVSELLEKKLSKQTNNINAQITHLVSLLQEGETRLLEKINSSVKEAENRLLNEINNKFHELKTNIHDVNERVLKLENENTNILELKREIKKLKIQSQKHSNSLIACDLRINSVPFTTNENLYDIFNKICQTVSIPTPQLQSIHRLKNKNNKNNLNSPDGVIIAKMMTPYDKNFVLKAINAYQKQNKNLPLSVLGFEPDDKSKNFYVHENLTNGNFKILREAVSYKKQKRLHSAYSFRGLVYIKKNTNDDPICIESIDELNSLFRPIEGNSNDERFEQQYNTIS